MRAPQGVLVMRFSGSLLSSFILFVFSFSPFWRVLSHFVATFLGLWKCGVTIAECAHVHSSAQPSWNVYNLPRTATAEISTELDESWLCVCLRTILLQSVVSPGAPEISFPSALVVFSLFVSSESYLLSQGGKFSIGVFFEQDLLLSLSAKITFGHDFLSKCFRGILFVCFLGVLPFVTRREILFWHACRHVRSCVLSEVISIAWAVSPCWRMRSSYRASLEYGFS